MLEQANADCIFPSVETDQIPPGWASVPVELYELGNTTNAAMVAGSVGMRISSSGTGVGPDSKETGLDTIQPASGWWMYETS